MSIRPSPTEETTGSIDVAVVNNPLMANVVGGNGFWMQGGSLQFHSQLWQRLGAVADVSGLHTAITSGSSGGARLDMVIASFGPRYTWKSTHRR
ncbi:MAG: hypothetical protein ABSD59_16625 [Terracidiphilus sp.]|jgi:hypothetical protein